MPIPVSRTNPMFEVFYCSASVFSSNAYATGSRRFDSPEEFIGWLLDKEPKEKPVLITGFVRL